jgi:hypothetical protein
LAVFFTPTMISGIPRMKYSTLVAWNFVVGAVYAPSVGPPPTARAIVLAQRSRRSLPEGLHPGGR